MYEGVDGIFWKNSVGIIISPRIVVKDEIAIAAQQPKAMHGVFQNALPVMGTINVDKVEGSRLKSAENAPRESIEFLDFVRMSGSGKVPVESGLDFGIVEKIQTNQRGVLEEEQVLEHPHGGPALIRTDLKRVGGHEGKLSELGSPEGLVGGKPIGGEIVLAQEIIGVLSEK